MRRRAQPAIFALALAVVSVALRGSAVVAASPPSGASAVPVVVAQVPAGALAGQALAGGTLRADLGQGGRLVLVDPGGRVRVLTGEFASAADPEIAFDGERILFAGQKEAGDPWCVFEMKRDGSDPRQITCGAAGARQPVYQPTVYTITATNVEPWIQVGFVGVNPGETNEAGVAPNTSLWSVKTDGTALRRISFNLSNDMDPTVLPDGRMVYASWLRHAATGGEQGRIALLGLNADGTDHQLYVGAGLRVKQMPAPTADGRVVFVEGDTIAGDGSGRLASVSQMRPLHSYRSLTRDEDGSFRAPESLPDGRLLVAWRPARAGQATFGIYRFDPTTGKKEQVLQDPVWHSLQAKVLAARSTPDARSSVVREDDREGRLFTLDVGVHDLGVKLPRGEGRRLRIVEGVPASAGNPVSRRLLGTIPLAADGSFQAQVPANTPLQVQLLDGDGLALRSSAWIWVRNHGQQGCVGCHEDPERTPSNRFVKALQAPAPVLNQPPEKRRTVRYAADVKPVVESKCLACHGAGGRFPRLDGEPSALAGSIVPGAARRSRLLWHLLGRNAARPYDAEAGSAAPAAMPMQAGGLSADELQAFIEWIDLGGQP